MVGRDFRDMGSAFEACGCSGGWCRCKAKLGRSMCLLCPSSTVLLCLDDTSVGRLGKR